MLQWSGASDIARVVSIFVAVVSAAATAGAGSLTGTVTDGASSPVPGIEVSAYADGGAGWQLVAFTETSPNGGYVIDGLTDGVYRVLFRDWSQTFAFEYHPDAPTIETAQDVPVFGSQVVDAVLDPGGGITGLLTDAAGAPLEFPMVFVYAAGDEPELLFVGSVDEPTGAYEVGGLPTGDYIVQFSGYQGLASYNEYFDGAETIDLADPVAVTIGETTEQIDGELGIPPGGVIAGRITDPYLRSFDFARVSAYRWDGADWVLAGQAEATYYESEYELPLPPGDYRLLFEGGSFLQVDLPARELFDDVGSIEDATSVTVVLEQRLDGFDVAVGNLSTGSISGTVTDAATGAPLSGIEVWVSDRKGRVLTDQIATTTSDGGYTVGGLWPEGYRVEFYDPDYAYGTSLIPSVLVAEDPVQGIDAVLDGSGSGPGGAGIRGEVIDASTGQPIEGIRVRCVDEIYGFVPECTTHTLADGSYRLAGFLTAGEYFVGFSAPNGGWADEWYDNVIRVQSATPVSVVEGAWSDGINAALEPAGAISGSVTNSGGGAFPLLTVTALRWDGGGWTPYKTDLRAYETDYQIGGLPEGTYRVKFRGGSIFNPTFGVEEFYDDVLTLDLATDVVVTVGSVTPGIGAVLGNLDGGEIAIANPSFDDDLDGWSTESTDGSSVHHGGVDVAGSALSGAAEVVSSGGMGTTTVAQCVAVDGGSGLRFGAWSRVAGGAVGSPWASVRLEFFADPECSGEAMSAATSGVVVGDHDWLPVLGVASAPSGAVAARLALVLKSHETASYTAHWDEASIDLDDAIVFTAGFEGGGVGEWSTVAP